VIHTTEGTGAARVAMRRELGEWVSREGALTPHPGLRQHPFAKPEPEGALAQMMPWHSPLRRTRNAVQSVTAKSGGLA
jgi:hypothetical protein